MQDNVALEAYRAELKERDDRKAADLEARLDFEQRSDELKHKRHIERLLEYWPHATVTLDVAEALGLTPLQYVAQYGSDKLNRFVAAWRGNNTQAAIEAGYGLKRSSASAAGTMLMQIPLVYAAIREKIRGGITGKILSLQELQVLWSEDAVYGEDPKIRHQAREALAKTYGAFVQKGEMTVQGGEKPVQHEHAVSAVLLDDRIKLLKGEE